MIGQSILKPRRDVWLNDLPFSNVDSMGNRWIIEDIDGWWDLPPASVEDVERTYTDDGSFYAPGRFSSRAIRLVGRIIPASNRTNSANLARQEFNRRLMLVRQTGLLQVMEADELGGGKQSEVVIVARPIMKSEKLNGVIDFDVQFRAPDPRKYSVYQTVVEAMILGEGTGSGRRYDLGYNRVYEGPQSKDIALVTNEGDYNTFGTIRLHGPVDDPGAHHLDQDRHISFPGLRLAAGEFIDVNLREKTILSESGISLRDRMADSSKWFNFDPGDNRVAITGTSYLKHVPGVPDVKNMVVDPSFESDDDGGTMRTVRVNNAPNPSGSASVTTHVLRETLFPDPQATSQDNFSVGTVSGGVATSPSVTLSFEGGRFPADGDGMYHFVQMEVKPTTSAVTTAKITASGRTSGDVQVSSAGWTKVRVDGFIPANDYDVSLTIAGAAPSHGVQLRNIMVLKSTEPIAGVYPYWNPVEGMTADGVETKELAPGRYIESYDTPDHWEVTNNPDAKLRVMGGEVVLIPSGTADHIVSFGRATRAGTDITYGATAEGATEIRLYNDDTGVLLQTTVPSHLAYTYTAESPVYPRLEATISVLAGSQAVSRKIFANMITYDGGTTLFTDLSPDADGMFYDYYSDVSPARERVSSFVTDVFTGDYNYNARETSAAAFEGSRSLEVTYNITPEDQEDVLATPISRPNEPVNEGEYHARARIMANQASLVTVRVEGAREVTEETVSVNPGHWTEVSFPFLAMTGDVPYLTVTPSAGDRNLTLYVDAVGILTGDMPYFDGSTEGPYTWTGAPHASSSATIPVVGVPAPRMEIMYRNAWIG